MTHWIPFFQTLCLHRQGYRMTLQYADAVDHPGDVAGCLFMVPLPSGHSMGVTAHAKEWIATGESECT